MSSFNIASLLGLLEVLVSFFYFGISLSQLIRVSNIAKKTLDITNRVLQLILVPFPLLLSGCLLIFNGWRLDPLL
jgi:hypothetical protein